MEDNDTRWGVSNADRPNLVRRGGPRRWLAGGLAICGALLIGHRDASARPCAADTPACHLENGKRLLDSDPRRAAEELLASYQLDERTDTLVLYATALQRDHRYALALETWRRVIVFRDSELEAAKETARSATGRKRAAARTAAALAQKQSEQAADAILELWPRVARVRIRLAPGQQLAVTRDGAEVDPAQDVVVNAGRDELVFTRKDGSVERVVVEVAPGALAKVDAPAAVQVARPAEPPAKPARSTAEPPAKIARPTAEPPAKISPPAEPPAKIARPAAEPPRLVPPPKPAEPSDEPADEPATLTAERVVAEPRSRTMSRVGLGLVAGGVATAGVAVGLAIAGSRDRDRSHALGCSSDDLCPSGPAADLAQQANDRTRLAQIGAISAGVLAATGATLWFLGRRTTHRTVTDVALHVGPSGAAISGRF